MFCDHVSFPFDNVFGESATNEEVYMNTATSLVPWCVQGGISTLFAYGQTGSGKTHTMSAINELIVADLFAALRRSKKKLRVSVKFFEIQGSHCFDLLNERQPVTLRQGADGVVHATGAVEPEVHTAEQTMAVIGEGLEIRRTRATAVNDTSSRSHAVLRIYLREDKKRRGSRGRDLPTDSPAFGRLTLVDLAGSERHEDSKDHDAVRMKEAADINSSLMALKECLRQRAATSGKSRGKVRIGYRASKLTQVLKSAFTETNSMTVVIATVSPTATDTEHSINTLRHASLMKASATDIKTERTIVLDEAGWLARHDPLPTAPAKWTHDQAVEWLCTAKGGLFAPYVDAFPAGIDGRQLVRLNAARLATYCGENRRLGEQLFSALRAEMSEVSDAAARRRDAMHKAFREPSPSAGVSTSAATPSGGGGASGARAGRYGHVRGGAGSGAAAGDPLSLEEEAFRQRSRDRARQVERSFTGGSSGDDLSDGAATDPAVPAAEMRLLRRKLTRRGRTESRRRHDAASSRDSSSAASNSRSPARERKDERAARREQREHARRDEGTPRSARSSGARTEHSTASAPSGIAMGRDDRPRVRVGRERVAEADAIRVEDVHTPEAALRGRADGTPLDAKKLGVPLHLPRAPHQEAPARGRDDLDVIAVPDVAELRRLALDDAKLEAAPAPGHARHQSPLFKRRAPTAPLEHLSPHPRNGGAPLSLVAGADGSPVAEDPVQPIPRGAPSGGGTSRAKKSGKRGVFSRLAGWIRRSGSGSERDESAPDGSNAADDAWRKRGRRGRKADSAPPEAGRAATASGRAMQPPRRPSHSPRMDRPAGRGRAPSGPKSAPTTPRDRRLSELGAALLSSAGSPPPSPGGSPGRLPTAASARRVDVDVSSPANSMFSATNAAAGGDTAAQLSAAQAEVQRLRAVLSRVTAERDALKAIVDEQQRGPAAGQSKAARNLREVSDFLDKLGMKQYLRPLRALGVTSMPAVLAVDEVDLDDMCMKRIDKRRFMKAVAHYRETHTGLED